MHLYLVKYHCFLYASLLRKNRLGTCPHVQATRVRACLIDSAAVVRRCQLCEASMLPSELNSALKNADHLRNRICSGVFSVLLFLLNCVLLYLVSTKSPPSEVATAVTFRVTQIILRCLRHRGHRSPLHESQTFSVFFLCFLHKWVFYVEDCPVKSTSSSTAKRLLATQEARTTVRRLRRSIISLMLGT